ncbi:MAG: S41 family peptidase [Gemmataceae bacterium]|nr:S41 family peptidase [Gemmataceae bacterium]MDW8265592.1 S41 family peptidase [Gemmataceae bacterium]
MVGGQRGGRPARQWGVVVLGLACLWPASAFAVPVDQLRRAEQLEREGLWSEALEVYEQLLLEDRRSPELRERCRTCLRRVHLIRRHRDARFQRDVLGLPLPQALAVYTEVLSKLQANYVDRTLVSPQRLFHQGLEEFALALTDETFRREHLKGIDAAIVQVFRQRLREDWGRRPVADTNMARDLVLDVALAARRALQLKPTVTVIEFACGACQGLDEYTAYLTPGQLQAEYESDNGDLVGIGVEVQVKDRKLIVTQIAPDSPAAVAGVRKQDQILRIDQRRVDAASSEVAIDQLRGEAGTVVELEVVSPGQAPRVVRLVRQAVHLPTVAEARLLENDVGYVRLLGFQKSTPHELDDALLHLRSQGMRVLILDLRGNPGGSFQAAVQVASRFLADAVIVSTQGQVRAYNRTYEVHQGMNALDFPMVVLVDRGTASAAEVVAGALKDNNRATLIGETTFGKGSIQCVLPLTSVPSGIRLTLAQFFSPSGQGYGGQGVSPHIVVAATSMSGMDDEALTVALQEAARLMAMRP